MSEITQPVEQIDDAQREYVEVEEVNQQLQEEAAQEEPAMDLEAIKKQFEDAGIEVAEIKDTTWSLGVPGKPDIPCDGYEAWATQYEQMADKVAKSKLAPETKLAKLEELKKSNQRIFSMLKLEQSLQHTKHMVARRTEIEAQLG